MNSSNFDAFRTSPMEGINGVFNSIIIILMPDILLNFLFHLSESKWGGSFDNTYVFLFLWMVMIIPILVSCKNASNKDDTKIFQPINHLISPHE